LIVVAGIVHVKITFLFIDHVSILNEYAVTVLVFCFNILPI